MGEGKQSASWGRRWRGEIEREGERVKRALAGLKDCAVIVMQKRERERKRAIWGRRWRGDIESWCRDRYLG